ncbi:hypothetical protein HDU76_001355, partial [Blyttiomyces sp. JEL0837]
MGNAASSSQHYVYHGFDSGPSRDARPIFSQLLIAAEEARSARRTTYTGRSGALLAPFPQQIVLPPSTPKTPIPASGTDDESSSSTAGGGDQGSNASLDSDDSDVVHVAHPSGISDQQEEATGFQARPPIPAEFKELASRILKGDLSEDILKLVDRTAVMLFISCHDSDTEWERNTLVKDVWPFLSKFCQILDLDFAPIDLRWNAYDPNVHESRDWLRSMSVLQKCFDSSAGPAFFTFLGDKYGRPVVPSVIPAKDFEAMHGYLTSHNRARDVSELFDVWYIKDTNAVPPVYTLRPVASIMPAFANFTDAEAHNDAVMAWKEMCVRLASLFRAGAIVLGEEGIKMRFGSSLTEREVFAGHGLRNASGPENFYAFQRTLIDIKRKVTENPQAASRYIDMLAGNIDKDAVQELARLRSKIRANRFYAVPYRADLNGLSPDQDRTHATYIKSFCDDTARILAESVLRHYSFRPFTRDWDPLAAEVLLHAVTVREFCKGFTGREELLEDLKQFLTAESKEQVYVLYGPSGVGKSAILSKAAEHIYTAQPQTTLVVRMIGTTTGSTDARSIMRSICSQLARVYGISELKAKVEAVAAESAEMSAVTGEPSIEFLLGDLDMWPPTSYESLKAALPFALGLATEFRPVVLILDALDELLDDDDARDLDWLPEVIPPNVKIILSTAPSSNKQPTYNFISQLYPDADHQPEPTEGVEMIQARHVEVPALSDSDSLKIVQQLQAKDKRTLTEEQQNLLISKVKNSRMPLYILAAWSLSASRWTSNTTLEAAKATVVNET